MAKLPRSSTSKLSSRVAVFIVSQSLLKPLLRSISNYSAKHKCLANLSEAATTACQAGLAEDKIRYQPINRFHRNCAFKKTSHTFCCFPPIPPACTQHITHDNIARSRVVRSGGWEFWPLLESNQAVDMGPNR